MFFGANLVELKEKQEEDSLDLSEKYHVDISEDGSKNSYRLESQNRGCDALRLETRQGRYNQT
jgi:hypothetical protein